MNALMYLISTVFDLYIMIVLLRIWLQATRADFYNPFSQFIVKATQPVLKPLRRIIPSIGSIDVATLLFAYVLGVLEYTLFMLIASHGVVVFMPSYLLIGLLIVVKKAGYLLFWILILRAILSWISQGRSPIEYVMYQLTEPFVSPIRKILPSLGGLDLSFIVILFILQFINHLLFGIFGPIWGII